MNILMILRLIALLSLSLTLSSCGNVGGGDVTSIRLAHTLDTGHPVHEALEYMDTALQEVSGGKMKLVIYPGGQLGSEREIIELIQIGTMGMTKVSASSLEAFVPEMKAFSLPYLFNSNEHMWKTLESDIGKGLLEVGTEFRIKGLGYFDAGSRSFYTTGKRVDDPEDLSGMKIRVMNSQSAVDMVNTMGGAATPVSWGELYTALQQGIVEGAENNPPSFYSSKHYEVSKYYLLNEHTSIPDVIVIGTHLWNSLSEQEREWVVEAMDQATVFQRKLWAEFTEESLRKVAEAGVEVLKADKRPFQESVRSLQQRVEGTPLESLVKSIRKLGDEQ